MEKLIKNNTKFGIFDNIKELVHTIKARLEKCTLEIEECENNCELLFKEMIFEKTREFKIQVLKIQLSMEVNNILESMKFLNDMSFDYFTMKQEWLKMKKEIEDLKLNFENQRYAFNNLFIIFYLIVLTR